MVYSKINCWIEGDTGGPADNSLTTPAVTRNSRGGYTGGTARQVNGLTAPAETSSLYPAEVTKA